MANKFLIPLEVERRLRSEYATCAYCGSEVRDHTGVRRCPPDKATIEHLNRWGPFYWSEGLLEEHLVIACGSCNSSQGQKRLTDWVDSEYCQARGIRADTVAERVRRYLLTEVSKE